MTIGPWTALFLLALVLCLIIFATAGLLIAFEARQNRKTEHEEASRGTRQRRVR